MKLIVGLGNPGQTYEQTGHNVGFVALDELALALKADAFASRKKFIAVVAELSATKEKIILAKPQTFMNNSGQAVSGLLRFYRLTPADLWVLHDDIDLPLGTIRISVGASAAGHRGVQSIIDSIGSQAFTRFRIGIQPKTPRKIPTEKYVLQKINRTAKVPLGKAIEQTVAAAQLALTEDIRVVMNRYN